MNARQFHLRERAQAWCDLMGRKRYEASRASGAQSNTPLGDEAKQLRWDATGAAGEQVVRWYFGCPCFVEHSRAPWDLEAHGVRIDVKATERRYGKLALHGKQASNADAYVLVIRTGNVYEIAGFLPAMELKQDANWERHFARSWSAPQDELRSIEDFAEWAYASGYLEPRPGLPGQGGAAGVAGFRQARFPEAGDASPQGRHGPNGIAGHH